MSSEPVVLKRKRSRPSDWWAAVPTSNAPETPQQNQPSNKRDRLSNSGAERGIQEAPTIINPTKKRRCIPQKGTENAESGEAEVVKTLRKGRSSNTQAELEAVATTELITEVESANKRKRGRPAQKGKGKDVVEPLRERDSNTGTRSHSAALEAAHEDITQKKRGRRARVGTEDNEVAKESADNVGEQTAIRGRRGQVVAPQEYDELENAPVAAAVTKKRRGRPRSVSKAKKSIEPSQEEATSQGPADGKKRRGRSLSIPKAKNQNPVLPVNNEAAEITARGRPSTIFDELSSAAEPRPASEDAALSKAPRQGRSSNMESELPNVVDSTTEKQIPQNKRKKGANVEAQDPPTVPAPAQALESRGRKGNSDVRVAKPAAITSSAEDQTRHKRGIGQVDPGMNEPAAEESLGQRSHGGRSFTEIEVETATSSFARNRNASNKVDNASGAVIDRAKKGGLSSIKKRSNSRTQTQSQATKSHEIAESQPQGTKGRRISRTDGKRRRTEVEAEGPSANKQRRESQEGETDRIPTYQHLAPVTRKVSRETIEAKWEPLVPAGIGRISQMVQDIQRSVVVHFNDDQRTGAKTALHMICRRLISKVSKGLPFPSPIRNTREDDFDFEKILDYNRALEAQITQALHANELLESEMAKETVYLETEQASLIDLEANAKSEATVRKDAGRRLHSLLQLESGLEEDVKENDIGLTDVLQSVLPFSHTDDKDLQNITKELNGHLDTIQGNIGRVDGISDGMRKSSAALQAALFDHLVSGEYEDIVLG